jgi:hypothetical protein
LRPIEEPAPSVKTFNFQTVNGSKALFDQYAEAKGTVPLATGCVPVGVAQGRKTGSRSPYESGEASAPRSRQFGRTSAPTMPHFVQTMRGPNQRTLLAWEFVGIDDKVTSNDRTPFCRVLARSIGLTLYLNHGGAIA